MTRCFVLHVLFLLLATCCSFAQGGSLATRGPEGFGAPQNIQGITELVVEVSYQDSRRAEEGISVQLQSTTLGMVGERFTDGQGRVMFQRVHGGLYFIKVRGAKIKELTTDGFNIAALDTFHREHVRIQPADSDDAPGSPTGVISKTELNVPKKALKEFESGNDAASKGDRDAAIQHYKRAAELYPNYAMAHNNLAALFIQSKDFTRADQELTKALKINPNLSWTIANDIKLKIAEHKYDEAIPVLTKALVQAPQNVEFLFLMCKAQFLLNNFEQALIYARKTYSASHQGFEMAHIVAGRSLELQNRPEEAKLEYKKLLSESPSAPEAEEARKSLARLDTGAQKQN